METEQLESSREIEIIETINSVESVNKRALKRKRIVLTLEDKMDVIKEREKGYSFETVARNFNIGTTTVKDIMKRKKNIIQAVSKDRQCGTKRKVVHLGRKPDVEERLYRYLVEKTEQGDIVCNKDLLNQATEINNEIYNEIWIPSNGWLKKFKVRYSIDTKNLNDNSLGEEDDDEDSLQQYEDEIEMVEEEEEEEIELAPDLKERKSSVSVLNACDILLDFMSEHDFPLKEIITIRVVKDKISQMPESQTSYEVVNENNLEIQPTNNAQYEKYESIENNVFEAEDVKL